MATPFSSRECHSIHHPSRGNVAFQGTRSRIPLKYTFVTCISTFLSVFLKSVLKRRPLTWRHYNESLTWILMIGWHGKTRIHGQKMPLPPKYGQNNFQLAMSLHSSLIMAICGSSRARFFPPPRMSTTCHHPSLESTSRLKLGVIQSLSMASKCYKRKWQGMERRWKNSQKMAEQKINTPKM